MEIKTNVLPLAVLSSLLFFTALAFIILMFIGFGYLTTFIFKHKEKTLDTNKLNIIKIALVVGWISLFANVIEITTGKKLMFNADYSYNLVNGNVDEKFSAGFNTVPYVRDPTSKYIHLAVLIFLTYGLFSLSKFVFNYDPNAEISDADVLTFKIVLITWWSSFFLRSILQNK
jgi:hypothetical protein